MTLYEVLIISSGEPPGRWSRRPTLERYTEEAAEYLKQWDRKEYRIPPFLQELVSLLPKGCSVLDLGCGPGQDSRHLKNENFNVVGLDGTWPFLQQARRRSNRLSLVMADFTALPFRRRSFLGIWAAASLIHLSKKEFKRALLNLREILLEEGILAGTFSHGRGSGYIHEGWIPGRYFSFWHRDELAEALLSAGLKIISLKTVSNRERKGRWLNVIAQRSPGRAAKSTTERRV